MPLIVRKAIIADVDRLAECLYAAFLEDPWGRVMFPKQPHPSADTPTKRRYRKQIESDSEISIMKVVDTDIDQMAKREWDEGTNVEAADALVTEVSRVEERVVAGSPHCCLGLLDIHPDHQRRGAGGLLVQWGTEIADKHGLPCFLAASPMGLGLYRRHGFEDIGHNMDLDMSKHGGEGMYRYVSMLRPAKKT